MQASRMLAELERAGSGAPLPPAWERHFAANYPDPGRRDAALQRYLRLLDGFRRRFGDREALVARAPGRVNLIGEHTDYNGLPVLPVAVDRDIVAVFAAREEAQVTLENLEESFGPRTFPLSRRIPPYPTGDWGNYGKAGIQGILDNLWPGGWEGGRSAAPRAPSAPAAAAPLPPRGLDALLHGEIPREAGLSSSSALVVLSALLFLAANRIEAGGGASRDGIAAAAGAAGAAVSRLQLAEWMARAEHYVGTQGGGMDQAISLLGRSGQALKIDFFPLRVAPVGLPPGFLFVVADSTVRAAKTGGAMDRYNRRSIECRLAVAVLNRELGSSLRAPMQRLGDLAACLPGVPAEELPARAAAVLHDRPYTLEEIARLLGGSPRETAERFCRRRDGSVYPQPPEGFKLRQRTQYVLEEGRRVEQALAALRAGDMAAVGRLMNRSHEGGRDLYEISCPELDRLVEIARASGALGSRLTGAGFGGCTISLVREAEGAGFIERVSREYYGGVLGLPRGEAAGRIFACRAVDGASVVPGGLAGAAGRP